MEIRDLKTSKRSGRGFAIRIFGSNTKLVLAFLARLPDLSPEDFVTVANAWWQADSRDRAEAWAQVTRTPPDRERYRILAAASVARQEAMDAASRYRWPDSAFWAAAADAGAALAAGDRIGRHYETLIFPLAAVMPWLPQGHGEVESGEGIPDGQLPPGGLLQQGA
jgi:hypothetical protein